MLNLVDYINESVRHGSRRNIEKFTWKDLDKRLNNQLIVDVSGTVSMSFIHTMMRELISDYGGGGDPVYCIYHGFMGKLDYFINSGKDHLVCRLMFDQDGDIIDGTMFEVTKQTVKKLEDNLAAAMEYISKFC